jgi:hypothetical protein
MRQLRSLGALTTRKRPCGHVALNGARARILRSRLLVECTYSACVMAYYEQEIYPMMLLFLRIMLLEMKLV